MKKNILIVTHKMVMGGIEKSLLSMVNLIDKDKYNVTVFLEEEGGELRYEFPDWVKVKVIPNINKPIKYRIINVFKQGRINKGISICYYTLLTKITKKSYKGFYYYPKINTYINEYYDLAIAYHTPISFPTGYVIDNINAKQKIIYIHCDMDQYKRFKEWKEMFAMNKCYYKRYDKICCVSNQAKEKFLRYYPKCACKTEVFYNILDKNEIEKKAMDKCSLEYENDYFKIVTVGRLSKEKGQAIIPKVLKKLINTNIKVKWYCVGDGDLRKNIEKEAIELGIQQNLILLGNQKNPYPYIKNTDLYVQTSIYEGFCITLAEAKILNKPIVTTNFVGVNDQIINGKNGIIVEANEEEIYNAIKKLFNDKELRSKFELNLKYASNDYSNEIKKIYKIMS